MSLVDSIIAFWNNKGGTGKTSLSFQTICHYADRNRDSRILVLDVCPQANLSELFLGGLVHDGGSSLLERQGQTPRCTVGGYFQQRLPNPYSTPQIDPLAFITTPHEYNSSVPENIDIVCGDPLLELQANAISTLANNRIPGTNTWVEVIDWISDFLEACEDDYDVVFIDANPSFSIYTQIGLSACDKIVLPVMADDSSRRAIQNAFSLLYGLRLPSEIYAQHAFATHLQEEGRTLPKTHLIVKNRLTQYMGPASAYNAVLQSIQSDISALVKSHPDYFSFTRVADGIVDVRDFQTTGVVAFARGCPFYQLRSGKLDVAGRRIQVNEDQRLLCVRSIDGIVRKL
ncbi:MAG: ParA family protein [Verrucomicrobiales bacterium]|nr:ParA family protein [Verrucomicrobiales bacterium]MCP5527770.1 ParA family protein [Verrucomicrobiales bacterium]